MPNNLSLKYLTTKNNSVIKRAAKTASIDHIIIHHGVKLPLNVSMGFKIGSNE